MSEQLQLSARRLVTLNHFWFPEGAMRRYLYSLTLFNERLKSYYDGKDEGHFAGLHNVQQKHIVRQ